MARVTRTKEYMKVMDELAKVNPKSPSDNDTFVKNIREMVDVHMKHLGHALRYHNEQHPLDQHLAECDERRGGVRDKPPKREKCSAKPCLMFSYPRNHHGKAQDKC